MKRRQTQTTRLVMQVKKESTVKKRGKTQSSRKNVCSTTIPMNLRKAWLPLREEPKLLCDLSS